MAQAAPFLGRERGKTTNKCKSCGECKFLTKYENFPVSRIFLLLCLQFLRNKHLKITLMPHIFRSSILTRVCCGLAWAPTWRSELAHEDTTVLWLPVCLSLVPFSEMVTRNVNYSAGALCIITSLLVLPFFILNLFLSSIISASFPACFPHSFWFYVPPGSHVPWRPEEKGHPA